MVSEVAKVFGSPQRQVSFFRSCSADLPHFLQAGSLTVSRRQPQQPAGSGEGGGGEPSLLLSSPARRRRNWRKKKLKKLGEGGRGYRTLLIVTTSPYDVIRLPDLRLDSPLCLLCDTSLDFSLRWLLLEKTLCFWNQLTPLSRLWELSEWIICDAVYWACVSVGQMDVG